MIGSGHQRKSPTFIPTCVLGECGANAERIVPMLKDLPKAPVRCLLQPSPRTQTHLCSSKRAKRVLRGDTCSRQVVLVLEDGGPTLCQMLCSWISLATRSWSHAQNKISGKNCTKIFLRRLSCLSLLPMDFSGPFTETILKF